jgi:hypothetical protein
LHIGEEFEVDELRAGLELATEEELQVLTEILFRRKFNPLDYVYTPDPLDVQSCDRQVWIDALEDRFRFLAADGLTVLRGQTNQVNYRQVLIQVCRHLKIPYGENFSTMDLEAELFLNLLDRAWKKLPAAEQRVLSGKIQRSLSQSQLAQQLPTSMQQDPLGDSSLAAPARCSSICTSCCNLSGSKAGNRQGRRNCSCPDSKSGCTSDCLSRHGFKCRPVWCGS